MVSPGWAGQPTHGDEAAHWRLTISMYHGPHRPKAGSPRVSGAPAELSAVPSRRGIERAEAAGGDARTPPTVRQADRRVLSRLRCFSARRPWRGVRSIRHVTTQTARPRQADWANGSPQRRAGTRSLHAAGLCAYISRWAPVARHPSGERW